MATAQSELTGQKALKNGKRKPGAAFVGSILPGNECFLSHDRFKLVNSEKCDKGGLKSAGYDSKINLTEFYPN